jgi:hypothetical protein
MLRLWRAGMTRSRLLLGARALLDVAAAAGVVWLDADGFVSSRDLEAAKELAGLRVEPGDAAFVHTAVERRAARGHPADLVERAGVDLDAVFLLPDRDVAVFAGDCVERLPVSDDVSRCRCTRSASPPRASRCSTGRFWRTSSRRAPGTDGRSSCRPRRR